jgi:F0F1-type ATP synthase assembly protein I
MADNNSNIGRGLAYGLEIAVGAGLGYFAGQWIDRRYRTEPWGMVVCVMLGLAAGMYLLIKDAIRDEK